MLPKRLRLHQDRLFFADEFDSSRDLFAVNGDVPRGDEAELHFAVADLQDFDFNRLADANFLIDFAGQYEHQESSLNDVPPLPGGDCLGRDDADCPRKQPFWESRGSASASRGSWRTGNGAGRIVAGMASDAIGRKATMFFCFSLQAVLIVVLSRTTEGTTLANTTVLSILSALIGANYGANLALFPSVTKDYYGLRNFGTNYGLVFTAWGVGGFMLALLAGKVYDATQSFSFAYYCSAVLLAVAALVTFVIKPPHQTDKPSTL